jgi:hypothetical protein
MIDQAVSELTPLVGVRSACVAVGEAQGPLVSPAPPEPGATEA